jgi:predicted acetyltransferase
VVKRGSEVSGDKTIWDVAEFFVVRGYRRHGIGTAVEHKVWRQFPGRWEVRVMQINDSARHFWAHAIQTFTGQTIESAPVNKNGKRWHLFIFESPHTT